MEQSVASQIHKVYALSVAVDRLVFDLEDEAGDKDAAIGCIYALIDEIKTLVELV